MKKCHRLDCQNNAKGKYCSRSCSAIYRFTGNKFRLGTIQTQETKDKIGKGGKGKKRTKETKDNIRKSLLGKKHSPERVAKHSERMKGNTLGVGGLGWGRTNTKYKKGVPLTDEHKRKLSESSKGKKKHTEESKKKMSESASKRKFTGSSMNSYFLIGNILCQGSSEKKYIEKLINENEILPTRTKWIKTPFGRRLLDFEFSDKYVEIKSKWTYSFYIGSDQQIKDNWISENIKKVEIVII